MPPFQPKASVPVPAPIEPSARGPAVADRIAATTCSRRTGRERMSLRPPSFVSPTSAFTERTASFPGWARVHATTASRRLPERFGSHALGVLVQANFGGVLTMDGVPVGRELGRFAFSPGDARADAGRPGDRADGSCMIVVATDAPLASTDLERLAARALFGLARTGSSFSNGSGDYAIAFSTAEGLRARHGVFFVTGNHEYYSGAEEWVAFLPTLGIRVLRNERVRVERGGAGFDLVGVDDLFGGMVPGHGMDLDRALAGRDPEVPAVLLAHQPTVVRQAAPRGVALQLSGHTHGGQIFPFNFLVSLVQPWMHGLHRVDYTTLYVHRGTGYWGPPIRVGAPGEVARIELQPA